MDVQGVCKSTVVRGEDDFPDGLLRITDCHDCVVYALAPLQYATVAGCSDCTVVRTWNVQTCDASVCVRHKCPGIEAASPWAMASSN